MKQILAILAVLGSVAANARGHNHYAGHRSAIEQMHLAEMEHMEEKHHINQYEDGAYFSMHDLNGDHLLDHVELKNGFGYHVGHDDKHIDAIIDEAIKEVDKNGDGKLNFDEFMAAMKQARAEEEQELKARGMGVKHEAVHGEWNYADDFEDEFYEWDMDESHWAAEEAWLRQHQEEQMHNDAGHHYDHYDQHYEQHYEPAHYEHFDHYGYDHHGYDQYDHYGHHYEPAHYERGYYDQHYEPMHYDQHYGQYEQHHYEPEHSYGHHYEPAHYEHYDHYGYDHHYEQQHYYEPEHSYGHYGYEPAHYDHAYDQHFYEPDHSYGHYGYEHQYENHYYEHQYEQPKQQQKPQPVSNEPRQASHLKQAQAQANAQMNKHVTKDPWANARNIPNKYRA